MIWISMVFVIALFYMPGVGVADILLHLAQPPGNYVYLGVGVLLVWGVLSLVLLSLVPISGRSPLDRLQLVRGFMYSWLPRLTNNIAVWLAALGLANYFLEILLGALFVFKPWIPFDAKLAVLFFLILVGALFFELERGWRYQIAVIENQRKLNNRETAVESRSENR